MLYGLDATTLLASGNASGAKKPDTAGVFGELLKQAAGDETAAAPAAAASTADAPTKAWDGPITMQLNGKAVVLQPLNVKLKATPIAELPEDQYQGALEALERMRDAMAYKSENMVFPEMPDASTYAAYQDYATITVGGKVVGKVDNQGVVTTYDNAQGNLVTNALAGIDRQAAAMGITGGPELAQFRAERIAGMLGGKVTKLPTALTQAQYDAAPKLNAEDYRPYVNMQALRNDPEYVRLQKQIQDIKAARVAYLAGQAVV